MPTWLFARGYRFGIVAGDCDGPPHVHVAGRGGAAKFRLDPLSVSQNGGYNAHRLREIEAIIAEHRSEFVGKWPEFCDQA